MTREQRLAQLEALLERVRNKKRGLVDAPPAPEEPAAVAMGSTADVEEPVPESRPRLRGAVASEVAPLGDSFADSERAGGPLEMDDEELASEHPHESGPQLAAPPVPRISGPPAPPEEIADVDAGSAAGLPEDLEILVGDSVPPPDHLDERSAAPVATSQVVSPPTERAREDDELSWRPAAGSTGHASADAPLHEVASRTEALREEEPEVVIQVEEGLMDDLDLAPEPPSIPAGRHPHAESHPAAVESAPPPEAPTLAAAQSPLAVAPASEAFAGMPVIEFSAEATFAESPVTEAPAARVADAPAPQAPAAPVAEFATAPEPPATHVAEVASVPISLSVAAAPSPAALSAPSPAENPQPLRVLVDAPDGTRKPIEVSAQAYRADAPNSDAVATFVEHARSFAPRSFGELLDASLALGGDAP